MYTCEKTVSHKKFVLKKKKEKGIKESETVRKGTQL